MDEIGKAGFDHPCKQTCSGWKQGYERGRYELEDAWRDSCKAAVSWKEESDKLRALLEKAISTLDSIQADGFATIDTYKRNTFEYSKELAAKAAAEIRSVLANGKELGG